MSAEITPDIKFSDLGLPESLMQALRTVGYEVPSPIQAMTIPPLLAGRDTDNVIDTWLFSGNSNLARNVLVNGRHVVRDFEHAQQTRIAARFRAALNKLAK